MRLARYKVTGQDAWYHIHCRISGSRGEFPLSEAIPTRKFVELLQRFSQIYFCEVAAFSVMGNHYHLVVKFQHLESISEEQLEERARLLYPSSTSRRVMEHWPPEKWERLRSRLFDVSEFMRSLQSAYARWYNHTHDRRGRFWADRFKSVVLEKGNAVLDCMLYVDLNPIRAGLVDRPEDWVGSSYYLRDIGEAEWLMPMKEIVDCRSEKQALEEYRARLFYRGYVPTKHGQMAIPTQVIEAEEARGFKTRGVYRKRLGYFVDGIAIGTEEFIRSRLVVMRETGMYQRRKNPIAQLEGIHFSLREQRSTAIVF